MEDTRPPNRHLLILEENDELSNFKSEGLCARQGEPFIEGGSSNAAIHQWIHRGIVILSRHALRLSHASGCRAENSQLDLALSIFGPLNL
jgi:hypothetical protein